MFTGFKAGRKRDRNREWLNAEDPVHAYLLLVVLGSHLDPAPGLAEYTDSLSSKVNKQLFFLRNVGLEVS